MTNAANFGMKQGAVDLPRLIARVRAEFPQLDFTRAVLNDDGEDHAVVVVDDAWVFRFPRTAEYARFAVGERRLLARLNLVSTLATPVYEMISAHGDFAGYPMIPGRQLSEDLFATLPREIQERIIDELGSFLACLHALPIDLIRLPDGAMPPVGAGSDMARRYRQRRADLAAALPDDLIPRVDDFYAALPAVVDTAPKVLIHGDLTEDHILLAPGGDRLAGVIDFTDAGAGDPAYDFTFLWAYGDWTLARALSRYGTELDVEDLVERSRWWWTRYSVDRLWWSVTGARACDTEKVIGDIRDSLKTLGL
jgi:aminoglycoside phosphotransferase (APT) family kinase protein